MGEFINQPRAIPKCDRAVPHALGFATTSAQMSRMALGESPCQGNGGFLPQVIEDGLLTQIW